MAGIYIHIPYCRKACHYCNFHFSTSLHNMSEMQDALLTEIKLQKSFLKAAPIDTIYFGGGTPSLLNTQDISALLDTIIQYHNISEEAEITLESNPDDITPLKVSEWKALGINRLSIGVQSFFEKDLKWMNRSHDATQAVQCIYTAQDVGLENLSLDLIFGSETTTMTMWAANLDKAISLAVPHLSCYGLTIEPNTALAHHIQSGTKQATSEQLQAEQFVLTTNRLQSAGFAHYEISNYARENKYALHNTNYWRQIPYLGIGPSAHSFDGNYRYWNVAHNPNYIKSLASGLIPHDKELLSTQDRFNEQIMTGLRTMWGCTKSQLSSIVPNWAELLKTELDELLNQGELMINDDTLTLSQSGRLRADSIMSQLFLTENDL